MVRDSENGSWRSGRERRRFGRFATRLPITTHRDDLRPRGLTDRRAECRLQLQDFSLGGLRADSPVPLKHNERLTLRLSPDSGHPAIEMTGRVVHCRRQHQRYQVGIEFCHTRAEAAASPFRQLPRLFSVAADYAVDAPPAPNLKDA